MFVKLDFDRVYQVDVEKGNEGFFYTVLRSGRKKRIKMQIDDKPQELFNDTYNLAFGPVDRKGRIKDMESINHADYSMAFSTILNFAKGYLDRNPYRMVGLDGSTNSRAYYYFRMIKQNYDYLSERFVMYGIKYYVRVKRKGTGFYENPFDFRDIETLFEKLDKEELEKNRELETMFNYFTFEKIHK
ncbi:MAG: hypothetical protein H6Q26_1434 [Bacteroidetes bacterium]|uniref:DUF6934 family protein n=1 Tax=Chitinophaga sp. LS1 TaxID=3051176 RepID=UPI001DBDE55C|nr:hypothetical protein [Chitinophaga sp. LS1]MBP1651277.1 hypothetical protein [Bacteroidota bacterium]WPV67583.1 hypothetical protein QQL36_02445 [Chitinophaga sp. LS1]